MNAFVIAALAVVASAAPGNYAATRSAALPIGLSAIAGPELKTIKVAEVNASPVALSYAAPAYAGYGYSAYGFNGYANAAPAVAAIKTIAPAELKNINDNDAPVAVSYAAPAYTGYGYAAPAYAGYGYAAPAYAGHSYAAPAPVAVKAVPAIAYSAPTVVRQHVEIPVTKTVHYADEQVVTGHTTTIHKPRIAAPAIAAPRTLVDKTVTNPATVSVQKYAAEVKTINPVAQPFDVHYDVPEPYAVPTPVHTAPVHLRKRVYAPAAYAAPAPVAYASPAAYAAPAPVAYAAHAAYAAPAPVSYAAHAAYAAPAPVAYAAPAAYAAPIEVKAW